MIQRIPKINIPATIAMCITFAVSALLVQVFRPAYMRPFCGMEVLPLAFTSMSPVLVRNQPGVPLTIGAIRNDSGSGTTSMMARNTSGRTISAYCLAGAYRDHKSTIWVKSFSSDLNSPFVLGLTDTYIVVENLDNVEEVWVDFVEFTDGTIWGPNTTRTLEKMNAARMGSRQAALYYSWILRTRGPDAVLASFKVPITNSQFDEYDQIWRDSFDSGVESVRVRLLSQVAIPCQVTTSLGRNQRLTDPMRTELYRQTLQGYINFRHQ